MDWATFKTLASDKKWKFEADNPVELNKVRDKNIKIWNHFGRKICKIYRDDMPDD